MRRTRFYFVDRHKVLANQTAPAGYRASWQNRGRLAKAKLHAKIRQDTPASEFGSILMSKDDQGGHDDYIEVHIYGGFNRNAIERVLGPAPRTREDRLLWKRLEKSIAAVGGVLEEVE